MSKPVNGQASWPSSINDKYAQRAKLIQELNTLQSEICALELVMLVQGIEPGGPIVNSETGKSQSEDARL